MITLASPLKGHKQSPHNLQLSNLFPWILLAVTYLFAILFQAKYGDDFLNSDMASEMILANELNQSGSFLLTDNWFYPSELRVLYQHIPFRLGLLLFPNNWHFARIIGQAIMLGLHAFSFIYLMSVLGHRKAGIYGAATLMLPIGFWYLFHGIFSGAYLTHMILMSVTTGLVIDLSKPHSRKKSVFLICTLVVLCFFQGLNGIRMLMNLYAPLCITVVLLLFLHHMKEPFPKPFCQDPHFKLIGAALLATVSCFAGFLFHSLYLSKVYVCITYEKVFWTTFTLSNLLKVWSDFLTLFGYPVEGWAISWASRPWFDISLMSLNGICGAAGVLLMLCVVFSTFRIFKLWDKLSVPHQFIALLFPVCLVVDGFVFSCLTSYYHISYWLPLFPLIFSNVIIWVLNEDFRFPVLYHRILGIALFLCIVCSSIPTHYQFKYFPPRVPMEIKPVVQWLVDNGYQQGYASFWNSNVITEHSDGQIEMWTLLDTSLSLNFTHEFYPMLQKHSHEHTLPQGKWFILISEAEHNYDLDSLPYVIHESNIVYNQNGYIVLSYESIEDALK